jgi:hypothetical protein
MRCLCATERPGRAADNAAPPPPPPPPPTLWTWRDDPVAAAAVCHAGGSRLAQQLEQFSSPSINSVAGGGAAAATAAGARRGADKGGAPLLELGFVEGVRLTGSGGGGGEHGGSAARQVQELIAAAAAPPLRLFEPEPEPEPVGAAAAGGAVGSSDGSPAGRDDLPHASSVGAASPASAAKAGSTRHRYRSNREAFRVVSDSGPLSVSSSARAGLLGA